MNQQYGIRWPTGSVFPFASRDSAEAALWEDGRGVGVLVVHEYEPGTPNCTEWREVEDTVSAPDFPRWLDAHPDAKWAIETFYATGDDTTSQGWEDTAALIGLILPPECAEGRCEH